VSKGSGHPSVRRAATLTGPAEIPCEHDANGALWPARIQESDSQLPRTNPRGAPMTSMVCRASLTPKMGGRGSWRTLESNGRMGSAGASPSRSTVFVRSGGPKGRVIHGNGKWAERQLCSTKEVGGWFSLGSRATPGFTGRIAAWNWPLETGGSCRASRCGHRVEGNRVRSRFPRAGSRRPPRDCRRRWSRIRFVPSAIELLWNHWLSTRST
jgi:hypothetical protein